MKKVLLILTALTTLLLANIVFAGQGGSKMANSSDIANEYYHIDFSFTNMLEQDLVLEKIEGLTDRLASNISLQIYTSKHNKKIKDFLTFNAIEHAAKEGIIVISGNGSGEFFCNLAFPKNYMFETQIDFYKEQKKPLQLCFSTKDNQSFTIDLYPVKNYLYTGEAAEILYGGDYIEGHTKNIYNNSQGVYVEILGESSQNIIYRAAIWPDSSVKLVKKSNSNVVSI